MPFPCSSLQCRSAKGLDCVFPVWFTQCGCVWFTHAMPFPCSSLPCRSDKGLNCVFSTWFTQCGCVWFTHAMPFPCLSPAVPLPYHEYAVLKATSEGHGRAAAWERHGMCELASENGTSRQGNGVGKAWYVWISIGEWQVAAGERHGKGMVCVNPPLIWCSS
jgi:hypothetical protein